MLINTFPFFVVAIQHWVTRAEKLNPRKIIGMLVAIVGVGAIMADASLLGVQWNTFIPGDALLLLSSILLAMRVVYIGKVVQFMKPGKLMFWHDVFSVVMFGVWSLCTETVRLGDVTWPSVWGLAYQGIVISGVCFVLHASLLQKHSASQISVFSFATPVFGVVFSVWLRRTMLL